MARERKLTRAEKVAASEAATETQVSASTNYIDFVDVKTGEYVIEGHTLTIKTTRVKGRGDNNPGYDLVTIEGDVLTPEGVAISIPHAWLFKNIEDLANAKKFAPKETGEVQRDMLELLQRVLASEIEDEKNRREEDAEASKKATEIAKSLEHPARSAIWSLATSNGKDVMKSNPSKIYPLAGFGPGQYGRYNIPNKGSNLHMLVDYTEGGDGVDAIRIYSIHAEHPLAKAGVKVGLMMHAKHLNLERAIPDPEKSGLPIDVYTHLCLFRAFLIQSLDAAKQKKNKAA